MLYLALIPEPFFIPLDSRCFPRHKSQPRQVTSYTVYAITFERLHLFHTGLYLWETQFRLSLSSFQMLMFSVRFGTLFNRRVHSDPGVVVPVAQCKCHVGILYIIWKRDAWISETVMKWRVRDSLTIGIKSTQSWMILFIKDCFVAFYNTWEGPAFLCLNYVKSFYWINVVSFSKHNLYNKRCQLNGRFCVINIRFILLRR